MAINSYFNNWVVQRGCAHRWVLIRGRGYSSEGVRSARVVGEHLWVVRERRREKGRNAEILYCFISLAERGVFYFFAFGFLCFRYTTILQGREDGNWGQGRPGE